MPRPRIRDQADSPKGYSLQSSILIITFTKGYNTSIRDRSYIPPILLWWSKSMLTYLRESTPKERKFWNLQGFDTLKNSKTPLERLISRWYDWLQSFPFQQFHVLFNSLFKVLFIFPSRYLFAIGLSPIFSLRRNLPPILSCNPKQLDSSKTHHKAS